jgi:hypothetical protein
MNESSDERPAGPLRLPPAYVAFLDCFAQGEFWQAHEVLEGAWRESRSGFYKGLILLASAYVHAGRRNAHGVSAQLAKAARELAPYLPAYMGQDVEALVTLARRVSAATGDFRAMLPPPDLTPAATRFRGDEPELGA